MTVPLIEAGVIEAAVATLQQHSPTDWVSWKTPIGLQSGAILKLGWTLSTLELPMNKTQLLLDKGFIDVCCSVLKAFEIKLGPLPSGALNSASGATWTDAVTPVGSEPAPPRPCTLEPHPSGI